jgi:uncharacterized protein
MKPGDHPDFYRFAPPPGTSRESSIRLDRDGQFWHEGDRIEHPALHLGLTRWISRHPDDGRYILSNGYDWTYFQVEDAPFQIRSLRIEPGGVRLLLSDETDEALDPAAVRAGHADTLYAKVKHGQFEARFSRHAQTQLADVLVEDDDATPALQIAGKRYRISPHLPGSAR